MTAVSLGPSPARRDLLARRVRLLVAATITYNVVEAVVAITAGTIASSAALIGFGLDSVIEVSSAAAVAWQFSARDHDVREAREKTALRVIALSFFALAAYVTVDVGTRTGWRRHGGAVRPRYRRSPPCLWRSCRSCPPPSAGPAANSAPAPRSPTPSRPCCAPTCPRCCWSASLLNAILGWSWADPSRRWSSPRVAVKEGRDAWRGEGCCAVPPVTSSTRAAGAGAAGCGCGPGCDCCD